MGKTYADNALNRRLGRVGQPHGSAPQTSSGSNANVYVDNPENRRLGRVGLPHGSAVSTRPQSAKTPDRSPTPRTQNVAERQDTTTATKTYVDNAQNRRLGRVGQPYGSASRPASREEFPYDHDTTVKQPWAPENRQNSSTATKTYVDNPQNRRLNRVGQSYGSASKPQVSDIADLKQPFETNNTHNSSTGVKTYVDNAENRRLGRVGQPYGSARKSTTNRTSPPLNITPGDTRPSAPTSTRLNVDNGQNRRLDRVGQPDSSASKSTIRAESPECVIYEKEQQGPSYHKSTNSSTKTYVDNAHNRKLGRVGLPYGSTMDSKYEDRKTPPKQSKKLVSHALEQNEDSDSEEQFAQGHATSNKRELLLTHTSYPSHHDLHEGNQASGCAPPTDNAKRYVDNAYNRKLGRVGLRYGEAVVGKNDLKPKYVTQRTYVDNAQNRKLGRVGLPVGSKVHSKLTNSITRRVYADTTLNRNLGRVGKPLGSMPRKSIVTNKIPEIIEKLHKQEINDETDDESGTDVDCLESKDPSRAALQQARYHHNRQRAEHSWKVSNKEPPKTEMSILRDYTGKRIAYNELQLHSKIGQGGFGEIYFAKWRETVVAVKALKLEKMTDKDVNTFAEEVLKFCQLNHPNIVKFIGACTERPDICIVMEYMMFSLFDAIHVRQIQFTDEEILSINQQICKGIKYLHDKRIAHCDIKTANILMDYVENNICEAKITDFGLSLVTNATLSLSQQLVQYRGTPRYSAPEILRGEILCIRDMMHADVYSLGLVMFEIIYEEEPYHDFTAIQMQKQVGEHGVKPEISNEIMVDPNVLDIIHKAWTFEPHLRPKMGEISDVMNRTVAIFMENEC